MSSTDQRAPSRENIYRTITDRIIGEMRQGQVPWVKPWNRPDAAALWTGLPTNTVSRRLYSGINVFILWDAALDYGWPLQRWLTGRQAEKLGGYVREGERGTIIFSCIPQAVTKRERARAERDGDEPRSVPVGLRALIVFNVSQCAGLPERHTAPPAPPTEEEIGTVATRLINATSVDLRPGGDHAAYSPAHDFIWMPLPRSFPEPLDYTRTLVHELGHWTGHRSRLDRKYGDRFGDEAYAREELVAEICSAFVCTTLGIEPTLQHSSYLASWLSVLENDVRAISRAATDASRASNYLLDFLKQPDATLAA